MKRFPARLIAPLALALLAGGAVGCGKSTDDSLNKDQAAKADRLDTIAKQSGGDWNKVSPADKDYMLKSITSGNENSAKMLLMTKSGKFGGKIVPPGVRPAGQ